MGYSEYLEGKPLIVTVAPTGGVHGKEPHPDLPETPEEIADLLGRPVATPTQTREILGIE